MRKILIVLFATICVTRGAAQYVPGHLTVILKDDVYQDMELETDGTATFPNSTELNDLNEKNDLIAMRPLSTKSGSPYRYFFDFEFPPEADMDELKTDYEAEWYVWWACPVPDDTAEVLSGPVYPADPVFPSLWHLNQSNNIDINAPEAWEWTTGSSNVVIAICGGGIAIDTTATGWVHARGDVARNIWTNPNDNPNDTLDNDNNGFKNDIHGWNLRLDNNDIEGRFSTGTCDGNFEAIGHGTGCASYAAAQIDSTDSLHYGCSNLIHYGWVGVAPNCKIMGFPIGLGRHRRTPQDALIYAPWSIIYAYENGATVFSYSYTISSAESTSFSPFIDSAYAHGMLFTNAFGNSGHSPGFDIPPYGISCQVIRQDGAQYSGNPANSNLEVFIPGDGGSSNGTAGVAGVIALMRSMNPYIRISHIRSILLHANSGVAVSGGPSGVEMIDAYKAIKNVGGTPTVDGVTGSINDHPTVVWTPNSIYPTSADPGESPFFSIEYVVQRRRTGEGTFQDIATVDTTAYTDLDEIITNMGAQFTTYYRVRTKTTYVAGIVLSVPSNDMGVTSEAYKIAVNEMFPKRTQLLGNYPNPFNPSTTIKFDLSETGVVSLKVFDILGKEVSTLANEKLGAGSYSRFFDASKLSSGVYFYRLKTGNFTGTRKLVLTK